MDKHHILLAIFEVIREITGDDTSNMIRETVADDIDGWDSLAHVRIILAVEAAFRIRFEVEEVGRIEQVGDLVDMVAAKI